MQGLLEYGHVRRAAEGMVFYVVEVIMLLAVDAGDVRLGRGRGLLGYDVFLGNKGEIFFLRFFQESLEGLAEFFVAEIDRHEAGPGSGSVLIVAVGHEHLGEGVDIIQNLRRRDVFANLDAQAGIGRP